MTDPTPAPLPVDVSGIDEELPDPGHEAIRSAALNAIVKVAELHQALMDTVAALQQTVADQATEIAALQARVTALEPTPAPDPTPVPTPAPSTT